MGHLDRPDHLWRALLGMVLRERRRALRRTLAQVAARAGVSVQYLSEVERGLKDPSSEVISAIAGALGFTLLDLTRRVGDLAEANQHRVVALRTATSVSSTVAPHAAVSGRTQFDLAA